MSRITSKLQVTIPRAIAVSLGKQLTPEDRESRLRLFDEATERHRKRPAPQTSRSDGRGWTREGLYSRGTR